MLGTYVFFFIVALLRTSKHYAVYYFCFVEQLLLENGRKKFEPTEAVTITKLVTCKFDILK